MTLDHTKFINRHDKSTQGYERIDLRQRKKRGKLTLLSIFIMTIVLFGVAITMHMGENSMIIASIAFGLISLGLLYAYRSYKSYDEVQEKVNLFQAVIESSRAARVITNKHGHILYVNKKFENLVERSIDKDSDIRLLNEIFKNNPDVDAHLTTLVNKAHRGLLENIELLSFYNEKERWFAVSCARIMGGEDHLQWYIEDITGKYVAEKAVLDEREKLIDFTDNAPVGFFSANEKGQFVFANATLARWLGTDLETLLEKGKLHTYLESPPANARPFDIIEKGGDKQVAELYMKSTRGKTFLAAVNQVIMRDKTGQITTRGVVYDLTAEREMRTALKESEARFQKFFEEAPLGIILLSPSGTIVDSNAMFAHMLGTTIKKIERKQFDSLIDAGDKDRVMSAVSRIDEGKQMDAPLEITLNGKHGPQQAQMHARRFREGGNTVLHFIDLSKQKELEEQFVQSQKMQAVGQLAGGIAHDFNNLLTAMIGFCDLLLLRHKPGDPSFSDIMQIKQNSNRAANLVRQLLAFSRQQTLRQKVQDITDILTELSHLLRRLIGANIELDFIHGEDLGLVKVDEGQMEQVLINLAVNARDAMDGGGDLTITTENFTNKKMMELVSEEMPAGHWIKITVSDTGCGIPKENISRIFEPFFTTKDVGQGTGLGLATVYGIIRQTGGFLDVQSKIGKGTSFVLYLPRASEADEEESVADASETQIIETIRDLTGTERILLVEDEDAVRTFSQRALSNKGYTVLTADSGESALSTWHTEKDQALDLLITDVVMPNMDGPTLAQHIRQESPDLKIIFISGYTEDKLKDYMGPNIWFLPKPFTLKQLTVKVRTVLEE